VQYEIKAGKLSWMKNYGCLSSSYADHFTF